MSCVFCNIVENIAPANVVVAAADYVAFLDRTPLFLGHTLVVPRRHVETYTDLSDEEVGPLMLAVQQMARAVQEALAAQGTFIAMNNRVSQSVAHLHVHVVPRTKGDGLKGFFWPRKKYANEANAEEVCARIRAALSSGS